jgi:subtilase family serine protease
MKHLMGPAVAFLAFAGCSNPSSPWASPGAPSWPSQVPARVAHAATLGRLDADAPIDAVLAMRLNDPDALAALVAAGQRLTPAELTERFAPSAADYARAVAALRAQGLEVEPSPTRTTITIRGRAETVEAALGTRLTRYADEIGVFHAPSQLNPPAAIAVFLGGAAGLDDAGRWWSHRVPEPLSASGSAEPPDLRMMYNVTPAVGLGDGETVAILGTGLPPTDDDVDGYVTKYTLPTNRKGQYARVFVGGPNRDPPGLVQNEYGENVLDVDMVLALAPHADVVHVLTATNSPGLFADGIQYIVNHVPQAHQVSVSYGTCERVAASEMLVMNQLFLQAKAQGQQWFFASGDNGTDGCRDGKGNKVLSVNWPSSSPYVMSVGGTQVGTTGETAWVAGGGGQSEILDKPAYQVGHTPSDGVRDQPDLAALAGSPGVVIYAQGRIFTGVQGTSAATPMWAAIWALLDANKGGGHGFTNGHERLYQLGAAGATGLRDITTGGIGDGTTPGYPATVGWDLATGWGVPDVATLVTQW